MAWPTPQDYNEAIEQPQFCFHDPELKGGDVVCNQLGLPVPYCGTFASVYKVQCGTRYWAVRCFLYDLGDRQRRYTIIDKYLRTLGLPAIVAFEYLKQGILVKGAWYPVLKMQWVEGELLNEYVASHLHQPKVLRTLASRWVDLLASLRRAGIAHGDLQHGNVLIADDKLKLIDYDGMFVPDLKGCVSEEVGHPNYQHPRRTNADFGPYLDNFPAWVIFITLSALAVRPRLWDDMKEAGRDRLLLVDKDFEDPDASETIRALKAIRAREVKVLVRQFLPLLDPHISLDQIPPLDEDKRDGPRHQHPARYALLAALRRLVTNARKWTAKATKVSTAWPLWAALIIVISVSLGWYWFPSLSHRAAPSPAPSVRSVASQRVPPDLVEVRDTKYASLAGLASGSREAQKHQRQTVQQIGLPLEVRTRGTGIVFRLVPAGSFTMGSPKSEQDAVVRAGVKREHVQDEMEHRVTLSNAFYCGKYEVTQAQWEQVMGSNPSRFKDADAPVENVSWDDCQAFAKKLCQMQRVPEATYRLLTEAEWEYACRAGSTSRYAFGESDTRLGEYAWYTANSGGRTRPVGGKKANAFGLYDMYGNASEWCQDCYADYPSGSVTDPFVPPSGNSRVYRGGGSDNDANFCRSAFRNLNPPDKHNSYAGLRIARTIVAQTKGRADAEGWVVPGLGMEMVRIEPGNFQMGSNTGDNDEKPVHSVRISHAFYIGKFEVTQGQYQAVTGTNPSVFQGMTLPVDNVSWNDAVEFCRKLTDRERQAGRLPKGYVYRLPTEAEWEYAARGGARCQRFKYAGSGNLDEVAWHAGNSGNKTHPVGQKKPNELGLYDVSGNVWEWCHDSYDARYYDKNGTTRTIDPAGPSSSGPYVLRGGSWSQGGEFCRSGYRNSAKPDFVSADCGFRVVASWPLDLNEAGQSSTPVTPAAPSAAVAASATRPQPAAPQKTVGSVTTQNLIVPDLGVEMVCVEPGTFQMGSNSGNSNEKPVHTVHISRAFWVGKREVTQSQYEALTGTNPSRFKGSDLPVENVSWNDAVEFCRKLTDRERQAGRLPQGCVYRLPTEAEWEYAARGGGNSRGLEYAGSDNPDEVAWHAGNSGNKTHPVGQKKPNELGLYDVSGNVWEWCADWSAPGYYAESPSFDPPGPSSGTARMVRGGSWYSSSTDCRSTNHATYAPEKRDIDVGFRVVVSSPLTPATDSQAKQELIKEAPTTTAGPAGQSTPNAGKVKKPSNPVVASTATRSRPFDLAEVANATYAPLGDLGPGSQEALDRQRTSVQQLELPLEVRTNKTGIIFRLIPAGSFMMGSPPTERERSSDEVLHRVTLTQPFYCGKFEVTQGQWEQVMGSNPSAFKSAYRDAPVEQVSWDDCQVFLEKLCQMEGVPEATYRLLTEAQWEYASRAGTATPFCYGNDFGAGMANFNGSYPYGIGRRGQCQGSVVRVGSFRSNAWGLRDMHGNACEWCSDWYGPYSNKASEIDPTGPAQGDRRVARGGAWMSKGKSCRSAARDSFWPSRQSDYLGLRLARIVPFHDGSLRQGTTSVARPNPVPPIAPSRRPDVIFVPTPQDVVDKMLELARLTKDDVVYDLGCGDGRIVVTAAKRYGCRAYGYDIDPARVKESLENVKTNRVGHLVTVEQRDIFTLDLSDASVIALYLLPSLNVKLIPQLEKLKPGSRIVSHDFDMKGVVPDKIVNIQEESGYDHTIYLWTTPLKKE